jgi:hypothetical protein
LPQVIVIAPNLLLLLVLRLFLRLAIIVVVAAFPPADPNAPPSPPANHHATVPLLPYRVIPRDKKTLCGGQVAAPRIRRVWNSRLESAHGGVPAVVVGTTTPPPPVTVAVAVAVLASSPLLVIVQ